MDHLTELERDLENKQQALSAEQQKGAEANPDVIKFLENEVNESASAVAQLKRAEEIEEIAHEQEGHVGGLKETIFQIFESILPAETGQKLIGITEYEEGAQSFRQMTDIAVNEHQTQLYTFVGARLEEKDNKISELTAKNINLDTDLQIARQKAEDAFAEVVEIEEKYNEQQADISRLNALADAQADRLSEYAAMVAAKDEQIAKLTEQLNKAPQAPISIPASKPSQNLQNMMEEANKKAKTALELAMEGTRFRGKITASESGTTEEPWEDPIDVTESEFRYEQATVAPPASLYTTTDGLDRDTVESEMVEQSQDETVTRAEFESIKRRMTFVERQLNILNPDELKEFVVGVTAHRGSEVA